jgi:predicted nucleic acid-binding protein
VVDSYAWIEIFLGSEKGARSKRMIEEAGEAVTPDIVLAEVARKYLREGVSETEVSARLDAVQSATIVSAIDATIGIRSAEAFLELAEKAAKQRLQSPSLFDAIVLATARSHQAKVITGDEHLVGLPEVMSI